MFGGSPEPWAGSDDELPKLADTTLLQFSELLHAWTYMYIHVGYRIYTCYPCTCGRTAVYYGILLL